MMDIFIKVSIVISLLMAAFSMLMVSVSMFNQLRKP